MADRRAHHEQAGASSGLAALACRVGLGRVAVAADAIDVLAEYPVGAPLPLTDRISYSVGVWTGEVVLSLSLVRIGDRAARTTPGLMLAVPGAAIRWAFEIVAPLGLVDVVSLTNPQSTAAPWLRTATLAHGGAIQFIDVPTLIAELGARAAERVPQ